MSPRLRAALDDAYSAFADMPAPTHLDASPLRDAKKILRTLTARPLRELTNEEIGPYSGWTMTTVGSEQDYRHFLPRILELSVSDPVWIGSEPPVIASRLERADWRRWPQSQQQAVTTVFYAAFDFAIRSDHEIAMSSASDWLCGIARLDFPVTGLLAKWRHSKTPEAALQLAWLVGVFDDTETIPPFWEEVSHVIRDEVRAWALHPQSREQLAESAGEVPEKDSLDIERALQTLSASTTQD
jgi:hypothetical protein